jgi:hypothetical protein
MRSRPWTRPILVSLTGLSIATTAAAQDNMTALGMADAIQVNSSFNAQILVANETEPQIQEQERKLKQSMYERATGECDLLRASIARTCRMTGISVSTQFNRSPGSPATFYINANINMEITLK